MQYVISDIHGDFFHFCKMLEKINFSSCDRLYILGDVLDKGGQNLKTLDFIRKNPGMQMIKGNHEYLCERYLKGVITGNLWDRCGGSQTRREVDSLSEEKKEELRDYLTHLPIYKKVKAGQKEYFLTHSGFNADFAVMSPESGAVDIEASVKAAARVDLERYLFSNDIHYIPAKLHFDKKIIVGHYPTIFLSGYGKARIFHGDRYIDIDTGNERRKEGGVLSCLRLDDGEEFYV